MKAKVTEQGVLVPKALLNGADEVEIYEENGHVVVAPLPRHSIWDLGKDPIDLDTTDASVNHDRYLYGSDE